MIFFFLKCPEQFSRIFAVLMQRELPIQCRSSTQEPHCVLYCLIHSPQSDKVTKALQFILPRNIIDDIFHLIGLRKFNTTKTIL